MRKTLDGFNKALRNNFVAPTGTPIMASGSEHKSRLRGGGGNCVAIKHNSTYQTIYAHMSKFANGIRSGVRVNKDNNRIRGSTGKSTGPHLYDEVLINGKELILKFKSSFRKILKENRKF